MIAGGARFPRVVEGTGWRPARWPVRYRGGPGYEKIVQMLQDGNFKPIAGRSALSCRGMSSGRAARPPRVTPTRAAGVDWL